MRFNWATGQMEEDDEEIIPQKKEDHNIKLKLISEFNPKVDWSTQKIISYSQFNIYSTCPHKWNLMYRLGLDKQPPNIHLIFGTAIHQSIQEFIRIYYSETIKKAQEFDIESYFQIALSDEYKKSFKKNKDNHFSSPQELREFYDEGVLILKELRKKVKKFFGKKDYKLVGIETPLFYNPLSSHKNVYFKASLDLIIFHEPSGEYYIYDFKTSTRGWGKEDKNDETKQFQLILYKQLFSELYNFPIENIDVQFLILRRKIEPSEWIAYPKRIQEFNPPAGKIKLKQVNTSFMSFINDIFDNNGNYIIKEYPKNPTKLCDWCYLKKENICDGK